MFVENSAGSTVKHLYDEEALVLLGERPVYVPYPYNYGFIPGVPAPDGDCLDCFLLDTVPVASGSVVDVEIVGVLDQVEEPEVGLFVEDHNLLARRVGDTRPATDDEINTLTMFITSVFGDAGPKMHVGGVRDPRAAAKLVSGSHRTRTRS